MENFKEILQNKILLLDGPMGTMIQSYGLQEKDFRGKEFIDHPSDLKGNNDILSLVRPDIITEIHLAYLNAGADLIETNTFNSNGPSMADYGMEDMVSELNHEAAKLARSVADSCERPVLVACVGANKQDLLYQP